MSRSRWRSRAGDGGHDRSAADRRSGAGRSLVGQSGLTAVAAATALVSGVVADAVVAATFGAGAETDALFVGGRIPLAVTTVLLIAANQALVPAFASWVVLHGERRAGSLTCSVALLALLAGGVLAAALGALGPAVCAVIAPGLSEDATARAASVLSAMTLVIPLMAVSEVLRAYLNARSAFVTPALINVVLNTTIIAFVLRQGGDDVLVVAWGYVAGSALRAALLFAMALRRGLRLNPFPGLRRREAWSAVLLCGRPLSGATLAPLVRVVEQGFVSMLPPGSISLLNYAYRLVAGLSGAVLFRSVIVTLVPRLTGAVSRGQDAAVRHLTGLGMRLMIVVSVPLATFIAVLAEPGVRLLFQRGRFGTSDAALLGALLVLFAASMPADAVSRAQMAPYFSRLNTKVPFRNALVGMLCNVALLPAALLVDGAEHTLYVIGLAYVVSRWVTVLNGHHCLRRDGLDPDGRVRVTLRVLALPVLTAAVVMVCFGLALDLYGSLTGPLLAVLLLVDTAVGGAVLTGLLLLRRSKLSALLRAETDSDGGGPRPSLVEGPVR